MKPTQRFNQRYVSFRLALDGAALPYSEAKDCVHSHFLSFFGEIGVAGLAFKFVKYDDKTGKGIIRCERGKVDETVFCMACLSTRNGKAARLEPLATCGTITRLKA
jgi:RNase P/RNase MRP subunit POP5